jgi:hypothetical protein
VLQVRRASLATMQPHPETLSKIKSNKIGAAAAAAFASEEYFEKIRVFERRESAGGTWYVGFPGVPHELKRD